MYEHTQFGTVLVLAIVSGIILTFVIGIILTFWFGVKIAWKPIAIGSLVISLIVLPLFYNLTVKFTQDTIHCSFGIGLISRKIPIHQIESAHQVKNPWYFGWEIRAIPGGWMFNVSGLDAIELTLKSNGKFRIGTDDPKGLLSAINQAKKESNSVD